MTLTIYTKGCNRVAQGNAHPITEKFTANFLKSVNQKLNNTASIVHYCYLPYKVVNGKGTVSCYINTLLIDATEENIKQFTNEGNNIALKGSLIKLLADLTPTNQAIEPEFLPASIDKAGFNKYDLFYVIDFKQNDSFAVTTEEKNGSVFTVKNALFNYAKLDDTSLSFTQLGQSALKKARFSIISSIYNKEASREENKANQSKIFGEVIMPLVDNEEPKFEGKPNSIGGRMVKVNINGDFMRTVTESKEGKIYINSAVRVLLLNNTDHSIAEYEFQPTGFVNYGDLDATPRGSVNNTVEVDDDEIPF